LQLAGQGMRGPTNSQPADLQQSTVPQSKGDAVKGNSDLSARELGQFTEVEEREMESHGDADRRRYGYDCLQRVVPWDDPQGPLPSVEASVVVRCHDISMQGVSFFWPEEPDFEHLLISLGHDDELVFMAAKVVHCKPVYMHGEWTVMVSCRFTKRMREFTEQWKRQAGLLAEKLRAVNDSLA